MLINFWLINFFCVILKIIAQQPSTNNCTWIYLDQPLSHFEKSNLGTYKQRICVFSDYWTANQSQPIFLYTGNESPVEEYVNNTGLLWNLAKDYSALVVFAEHRYFGKSIPDIEGMDNCLSYLSSMEALADYASLSHIMRSKWGGEDSAIIAFGGSYGGMLSSWLRILYPSSIDGAIAASAPILGFPLNSCPIDGSAQSVSYAASSKAGSASNCADNLKSSYVLISDIGKTTEGLETLSKSMNLCTPLTSSHDISSFLTYLQSPLFNLAEGSYPFETSYITYALTGTSDAPLPIWAMQKLCDYLAEDFGVKITPLTDNNEDVQFKVTIGDIEVDVDWDELTNNEYTESQVSESGVIDLLVAVSQSVQVWYNVTGTLESCIEWTTPAPSSKDKVGKFARNSLHHNKNQLNINDIDSSISKDRTCSATKDKMDIMNAWNTLTCNEGINLVNWWAIGVGNDLYWPPNQKKGYTKDSLVPNSLDYCVYLQGEGLYGLPTELDSWGKWIDTAYGGDSMQYVSNIVFSNGDLDPWTPAGVNNKKMFKDSQSKNNKYIN
jgi:lysosomal Pro-X carboxypeptidase